MASADYAGFMTSYLYSEYIFGAANQSLGTLPMCHLPSSLSCCVSLAQYDASVPSSFQHSNAFVLRVYNPLLEGPLDNTNNRKAPCS